MQQDYVAQYRESPSSDPWAIQGYKDGDVLTDDVLIETHRLAAQPTDGRVSIVQGSDCLSCRCCIIVSSTVSFPVRPHRS